MKTINIKTQEEFDALSYSFSEYTQIKITGKLKCIKRSFKNAELSVSDSASIESVSGSASIESVSDSASIKYVYGSASIKYVYGSASIKYVYGSASIESVSGSASIFSVSDSASIEYVSDSASIEYVYGSASIESVSGSASIESVSDSASIKYVSGSASIESVSGSASIEYVSGSASIEYVSGSASIEYVSGNSVVRVFSKFVKIFFAAKFSVIIAIGCKIKFQRATTVSYVENEIAKFDLDEFIHLYGCEVKNGHLILYKIVQNDFTDFYSGKIKYEVGKTVTAPDWNPDADRECGGGLHLSPSPELAMKFNRPGIVLKCSVAKGNIVVHQNPDHPHKVRCRAVKVLEDITATIKS